MKKRKMKARCQMQTFNNHHPSKQKIVIIRPRKRSFPVWIIDVDDVFIFLAAGTGFFSTNDTEWHTPSFFHRWVQPKVEEY